MISSGSEHANVMCGRRKGEIKAIGVIAVPTSRVQNGASRLVPEIRKGSILAKDESSVDNLNSGEQIARHLRDQVDMMECQDDSTGELQFHRPGMAGAKSLTNSFKRDGVRQGAGLLHESGIAADVDCCAGIDDPVVAGRAT